MLADSFTALVWSILSASVGIVLLGWGIRFFKTVIALAGFMAMASIAFIVIANLQERYGFMEKHKAIVLLGGSIVTGLIGAMLSLKIWMLALGAVGALSGLGAGVWAMSWPWMSKQPWLSGRTERSLFIAGASLAGCVLAMIFEKAIIVTGTSLLGAMAVCSGLDVFVKSGLNEKLKTIILKQDIANQGSMEPKAIAMLISAGALFLMGVIFQYRISGKEDRKKSV